MRCIKMEKEDKLNTETSVILEDIALIMIDLFFSLEFEAGGLCVKN